MVPCVAVWMVVYRNGKRPVGAASMASATKWGTGGMPNGVQRSLPRDPFVDGSSLWPLSHSSLRTDLEPLGDMAKRVHAAVGKGALALEDLLCRTSRPLGGFPGLDACGRPTVG